MATRSKLAVILHADVVGSTELVQSDERLAHDRIQDVFLRFSEIIAAYGGSTHELRGDALLAEFSRASDAISAALSFQTSNAAHNSGLDGEIRPIVRVGISLGEVVIADGTLTGPDVVLAQRLEQLAEPGGVCVSDAISQSTPRRLPFEHHDLGNREVKGFAKPVRAYRVALSAGEEVPAPEPASSPAVSVVRHAGRWVWAAVVMVLIALGGGLMWWHSWKPESAPSSNDSMAYPLPNKPSIAVLPFTNMSGDPKQQYFVDGMTEDLITNLSLYRELFVIARNSTFVYRQKAVDVKQVGRELGVAFVLEGSVRRDEGRVRINAQLIDVRSGAHVWGERFDREVTNVFELQDEITRSIAGRLAPEMARAHVERTRNKPTDDLDAWDLYLQAAAAQAEFTKEALDRAVRLSETAIARDANFAGPHIVIARAKGWQFFYGWTDKPEQTLAEAIDSARTAIRLDGHNAAAFAALGYLHRYTRNETLSIANLERAVELNPNDASIRLEFAHILDWYRLQERALPQILDAIRLSPRDPRLQMMFFFKAHILFHLRDFEASLDAAKQMSSTLTSDPWRVRYHLIRAANLAELGRIEEARGEIENSRTINPKLSLAAIQRTFNIANNHPENRRIWLESLAKAGMPAD